MEREDLLAFALSQHREKAEIVDLSEWIHTAVAGKKGHAMLGDGGAPVWARPPC
jgi:hypothetical protein